MKRSGEKPGLTYFSAVPLFRIFQMAAGNESLHDGLFRKGLIAITFFRSAALTGYALPPVVAMPWMKVRCARKNKMMTGIVKMQAPAISCAHSPP